MRWRCSNDIAFELRYCYYWIRRSHEAECSMTVAQHPNIQTASLVQQIGSTALDLVPPEHRELLMKAVELVGECFSQIREMRVTRESDPETGEQWSELRLTLDSTPAEAADASARFAHEWVATVPWPHHHAIHVSCTFA
jgi:hypothetical protein